MVGLEEIVKPYARTLLARRKEEESKIECMHVCSRSSARAHISPTLTASLLHPETTRSRYAR